MFICKGNICRSPFAEHMARKLCKENDLGDFTSRSFGLEVVVPRRSPIEAIDAARTFGMDLSSHISNGFDRRAAIDSNLIVVMEARHVKSLRKLYPELRNKLFLLPLFERDSVQRKGYLSYNIPDPYGKDVVLFQTCFQRITLALDEMLRTIYPASPGRG